MALRKEDHCDTCGNYITPEHGGVGCGSCGALFCVSNNCLGKEFNYPDFCDLETCRFCGVPEKARVQGRKPIKCALGYQGATDSCLTLTMGIRKKQFGVESLCWHIVGNANRNKNRRTDNKYSGFCTFYPNDPEYFALYELMEQDTAHDEFP